MLITEFFFNIPFNHYTLQFNAKIEQRKFLKSEMHMYWEQD